MFFPEKKTFLGVGLAEALEKNNIFGCRPVRSPGKTALLGAERTESLEEKAALLGAERTKSLEKTALWGAERNRLIRLQLQFQLQCCTSPELITWL